MQNNLASKFDDGGSWTAELGCQMQLLYQLCHNHSPTDPDLIDLSMDIQLLHLVVFWTTDLKNFRGVCSH